MYKPRLLKNASKQLQKIDPQDARRIIRKLTWLCEHFDELVPEPLAGDLAGLYKCREGDYRIIYQPIHEERVILVHEIGHRREIYNS